MKNKGKLCLILMVVVILFGSIAYGQSSSNTCGGKDLPSGMYCCDGIATNKSCDFVVVTPEKSQQDNTKTKSSNEKCSNECNGIKLNTCFPIIGNCIETGDGKTSAKEAFPTMMGALTKIAMALILIVCFIFVIVAGVIWAGAGEDSSKQKTAKDIIKKVAVTVLLLGFSGVILRLINPNFFG